MSERQRINPKNGNPNKIMKFIYLFLFWEILDIINLETLISIRGINILRTKIIGLIVCTIIQTILKLIKVISMKYVIYDLLVDILEVIFQEPEAIDLMKLIINKINKK